MNHRPIILSLTSMHESGLQHPPGSGRAADGQRARSGDPPARGGGSRGPHHSHRWRHRRRPPRSRRPTQVVGRHGVGYDQIDVDAATARGIQVVYTPGANTQSVAEHVFALMIGLSRHFPRMMAGLAAGNYHIRTSMTGREIAGKSLGIIGFGRIGRRVGETAYRGFGMKVALSRHRARADGGRAARQRAPDRAARGPRVFRICDASRPARSRVRGHDQPRDPGPDAPETRS